MAVLASRSFGSLVEHITAWLLPQLVGGPRVMRDALKAKAELHGFPKFAPAEGRHDTRAD